MSDSNALRIESTASDGVATVTLIGDVDMSSSALVAAALAAQVGAVSRVVVDVRAVGFMDSMGLRALLEGRDRLGERGVEVVLVTGTGAVARLLELTKLDTTFPRFESVEEAARVG